MATDHRTRPERRPADDAPAWLERVTLVLRPRTSSGPDDASHTIHVVNRTALRLLVSARADYFTTSAPAVVELGPGGAESVRDVRGWERDSAFGFTLVVAEAGTETGFQPGFDLQAVGAASCDISGVGPAHRIAPVDCRRLAG